MEGQFTDVNKKGLELSGYSRNELVGKNILETGILPPDQIEGVIAGIKGIEDGKSGYPYEVQLAKKNGERMTVEAVSFPMRKKGRLEVMGIAHDITERKKAAEALRASEEKLRAIFEAIEDGIAVADLEGNLIDMNESDIKLFGYERKEQLLNANAFLFVTEADRPRVIRDMSAVLTIGSGKIDRYRLMDKNGNEFDAEVSGSLLRNSQGKPTAIVNIIRDITERKRMEEAIRLSEAKLRAILNNMSDGISVTDMSGCIVDENEPGAKLMGYAGREEVLGLNGFDFIAEVDRARILKELEKSLTRGYGGTYQVKLVDRYGKEFDSELTGSLLSDSSGKPTGLVCVMRDITERKRMEEALKESEAKYRTLVEQSDQGTCILKNGRIVFANKALSKMNGYSLKEMYAMASDELLLTVHPDDRESYANRIKMRIEGKRMRPRHEYRVIRKDGTEIWFETFAKRILYRGQPAIQSTMADITERKQWESNLQQSKSDLSLYLSQINQAQEEERKRIARELHDDTIQEIVALSRQLDNLIDKRIGPEEERRENRRLIEDAQRKVDTILKGIRRFTRDLRPSILDDLGLVPALEWLTTDISEQFKIPIKISIRGKEQHIASDAALVMFRIAQESLRNACRHSGATHIQVELKYASQKVTLSITDNGQGFNPPEDTSNLIRRGKLGVAGMYERAQLIGANLSIKSNKNKGTSVTLEVNIK
jgi:PAS domain S-box-containing protein